MPGIEYFLSAITATSCRTNNTKVIHPGVAFWVGTDPILTSDFDICTGMRQNTFNADLKLMTCKSANSEADRQVSNVAMAVKDFGPGYVQSQVNAHLDPATLYLRERIYLRAAPRDTSYPPLILQAQEALSRLGLYVHVETF